MAEREEIAIVEEIRLLAEAQPFAPFFIMMASGNRYEIGPGDTLSFGRSTITVLQPRAGHYLLRSSQISEVSAPGGAT